jgi:Fe2+ transport system protein FeoA
METNDRRVEKMLDVGSCTLADLKRGLSGRVTALRGDSDSVTRLHALGFLPGRVIRHRNTAPLGDPVAFEINGQKISMRRSEARLVEIEMVNS